MSKQNKSKKTKDQQFEHLFEQLFEQNHPTKKTRIQPVFAPWKKLKPSPKTWKKKKNYMWATATKPWHDIP